MATKGLFRGIHVFVSGGTWDFYRHVYPGDRLYSFSGLESVEAKDSEFAGRSVVQVSRQGCATNASRSSACTASSPS